MCEENAGITTTAQLRRSGCSRAQLRAQVDAALLHRVRRGVYATRGTCRTVLTAASHGGPLACVTAARHLGLWVLDDDTEVHVWLRGGGHRHHPGGCGCVEHWDDTRSAGVFGIPSVARVLRQILGCRGVEAFFVALESAWRLGLIDPRGIEWLHRHTNDDARAAIAIARDDADSGLESLVRWRLREHGLRVRTQQRVLGVGRVDLLIGDRLIVETDGVENHDGPSLRHRDLVRDANAASWGYVTLRFDYALVVHDWDLVERAILAQVAAGHHLARARV